MREHHLPGDVRQWPTDPYALLGVVPGVSLKDLKKAYTSLIRQYRPEEKPEQFRRIRDAFESLQHQIKYYPWMPPADAPPTGSPSPENHASEPEPVRDEEPPPPREADDAEFRLELDGPGEPAGQPWPTHFQLPQYQPPPRNLPYQEEIDRLWERACAGEEEFVYGRLREVYREHPQDKDILLRLYWLLKLDPDLDHVRHPCDWLAESLRANGLSGPARELYRRHVANDPREALSQRYTQLVDCPAATLALAQFVEWRWMAAGRLQSWKIILDDVVSLRPRLEDEDEETWARLLLFAIDELAWFDEEQARIAMASYVHELEGHEHLHSRLAEAFSRLDFLMELAKTWRQFARRPVSWGSIVRLIPHTWVRPLHELRPILVKHLDEWRRNLRQTLEELDEVHRQAPILLAQLGRTLEGFQFSFGMVPEQPATPDEIEERTRQFLAGLDAVDYRQFRLKLFDFCLREFLPPEHMAEIIESRSADGNLVNLFGQVRNDWPLRLLCQGYRVFWG